MTVTPQTGWRDIGSAPRDGTLILLWRDRGDRSIPVIGHWSHWNRWWTTGEVDRSHDHVPLWGPSHWMPLPVAPSSSEERRG